MFKILTIAACVYMMYRLVKPSQRIQEPDSDQDSKGKVIDIDYEEIE